MRLLFFLMMLVGVGCCFGQSTIHGDLRLEREGEGMNLLWTGGVGNTYFLEYSDNLVSWSYMPAIEAGDGEEVSYGFDLDTDKMFFRLQFMDVLTDDPYGDDFDGDGVSNWDEVRQGGTGTSPFVADSNGDGVRDDGLVYGAVSDPDGFGLDAGLAQGLLARWDFEPTAGKTGLEDASGNGRVLSLSGQAMAGSFSSDGMVSYSGRLLNGHFRRQASFMRDRRFSSSIDIRTKLTVSFWMKLDANLISGSSARVGIFNTGMAEAYVAPNPNTGFQSNWVDYRTHGINVKRNVNGDELWAVGGYRYRNDHDGNPSSFQREDPFAAIPATQTLDGNEVKWTMPAGTSDGGERWMHMVLVRDRSATGSFLNGRTAVYVDGELVVEGAFRPWALDNLAEWNDGSCQVFLGQVYSDLNGQAPAAGQFRGAFDRVRVYDRALSAGEVEALYRQDIDGDGLWDVSEQRSLLWRDVDGDGVRSASERNFVISPFVFSAADVDHDGDGLASLDEQDVHLTDMSHPDSDGDLMIDGFEVGYGLDPLDDSDANLDTDGDGLSNLDEYANASDPLVADSDGDGSGDLLEVTQGSLPNDASDGGSVLGEDERVSILLGIGDQSGSESEDYVMNVFEVMEETGAERRIYTVRSGGHGEYKEETKSFFRKDGTYSFQIDWQSSSEQGNGQSGANAEGPDFDYTFKVEPVGDDRGIILQNYDPKGKRIDQQTTLLGSKSNVEGFLKKVETKRVLRVVMSLTPDYNRDGKIDGEDKGMVTSENPYRFWVNDDNDKEHEERKVIPGADIPGAGGSADSNDLTVDGLRDLVDFFPLAVDLEMVLKLFPKSGGHRYRLRHAGESFNYFMWHKGVADGSAAGYKPRDMFQSHAISGKYKTGGMRSTRPTSNFYHSTLKFFEQGKGILMVEANEETEIPLVLEVENGFGSVASFELPVKITGVEKMYRHSNLRSAGGGTGGRATEMGEPVNYPDDMPGLTSDKWFVLLHGYNVNGEEARGWHAEFFKRLYWSGSKAKFVGVSWRGEESQGGEGLPFPLSGNIPDNVTPNFHVNVINAFSTADDLAILVDGLTGDRTISAHSLGNMVISAAIQDHGMEVDRYFPFDAAVAMEAYDGGIAAESNMKHDTWNDAPGNYEERLWASEWHTLPWPAGDFRKKLTWRGRFKDVAAATQVVNFYSTGEEVLENSRANNFDNVWSTFVNDQLALQKVFGIDLLGQYAWAFQELLKGRGVSGHVLGSTYGGWKYNYHPSTPSTPRPQNQTGYYVYDLTTGVRRYTPAEGVALTDAQLMAKPFFRLVNNHSTLVQELQGKGQTILLAQAFPALTFAVGSNPVGVFGVLNNVNMMDEKSGWWSDADEDARRWLHGDIKDVAYPYTHKVYDLMNNLGNLDQTN